MAGQDVGHIHETIRRVGDEVMTTVETRIVINRLGSKVESLPGYEGLGW